MTTNIEFSVSLEEENSHSLTLTTISEAKKLDANLSKPENAAIARRPFKENKDIDLMKEFRLTAFFFTRF